MAKDRARDVRRSTGSLEQMGKALGYYKTPSVSHIFSEGGGSESSTIEGVSGGPEISRSGQGHVRIVRN